MSLKADRIITGAFLTMATLYGIYTVAQVSIWIANTFLK